MLHFALNQGGYLLLGPSETIGRQTDLFEPVSKKWRIFRRIGPARPERVEFPIITAPIRPASRPRPLEPRPGAAGQFRRTDAALVLEQWPRPPCSSTANYEILYFLGPTKRYLDVPTGEPTQDLMHVGPRRAAHQAPRRPSSKAVNEGRNGSI